MDTRRRYQLGNLAIAAVALGHATLSWPPLATMTLFVGGAAFAFLAEATVVALGLLDHAIEPQVAGVPVSVVLVWPAITYLCLGAALLVVPAGPAAAAVAALIGTTLDLATEPFAIAEGVWAYPDHPLSRPRIAGIPWWNVAGWFVMVFATASLPIYVGL
jgi:putative membrane protein